jgi:alpha-ketoglutaric semialdehyde dehydrogenase
MIRAGMTLIGGRWTAATDGEVLQRHNPAATDEVVAEFPALGRAEVESAVAQAAEAAVEWRRLGALHRGRVLLDAAGILRARADQVAGDIVREMGKTRAEADAELGSAIAFLEYYGGLGRSSQGDLLSDRRPGVLAWTAREPVGVVVLITPWNDPLATPARKLAPALITGNAVLLKPSLETPLSALHLAEALGDAGLPPGVLSVVTGPSSRVAGPLLDNDVVTAMSFTGSTAVGLHLQRQLAGRMRVQTEMGGKNAALVLPDADLDLAVSTIAGAVAGQTGQRCTATSRVVVHEAIADEFGSALAERVERLRVGPGDQPDVEVGPLVTQDHLDGVCAAVDRARSDGARLVAGGGRLRSGVHERGHFLQPTVLTDVTPAMPVWREEIFGPVVGVVRTASFEEGVALVNDSRYGLAASVFTRDLTSAHRFVAEADAGQVAVNLPTSGWDVHVPFGGFKESGSPFKEHGTEGLNFYTRVKSVALRT